MGSLPGEQGKFSRRGHPRDYGLISPADAANLFGMTLAEFIGAATLAGLEPTRFCMLRSGNWDTTGQDSWGPWYRWPDVTRVRPPRRAC